MLEDIERFKLNTTWQHKRIKADRPRQFLPTSLFIVTLSFANNFKTFVPAAYAQGRYTANSI